MKWHYKLWWSCTLCLQSWRWNHRPTSLFCVRNHWGSPCLCTENSHRSTSHAAGPTSRAILTYTMNLPHWSITKDTKLFLIWHTPYTCVCVCHSNCLHSLIQLTLPSGVSEVQPCVLEEVWGYYEEALSIIATAVSWLLWLSSRHTRLAAAQPRNYPHLWKNLLFLSMGF